MRLVPWRKLERAAGFIALFCIGTLILMFARPSFTNASKPQRGISDPVLALQMAHDVSDVDAILGDSPSPDREVMRLKQYEDFAFIAGYAALYLMLALLLARRYPRLRLIAILAAIAGLGAAVLDVTENFAILHIVNVPLAATTQAMVDAIRHAAIPKWGLGFLALGLLSTYLLLDRRRTAKIVGGIDALAAVIGLMALIQNPLLPAAAGLIGLGLIGATIVLLFIP
jgi:hypothetical protein